MVESRPAMSKNEPSGTKPHALRWGLVTGIAIAILLFSPELIRRLLWWKRGGGGETAMWGEPLFYMIILALPLALVGAMVGYAIDLRLAKPQSPPKE